jgi:cytochrome c biogenesis protein CcmG/thiol:disulfide interchange protein DsbE
MSGRITWIVIAVGLVIVVVGVALGGTLGSDPQLAESALIDKPAPEIAVDDLFTEETVRLSDHLGEVVVINFWASWCSGCRAEHAALNAAAAQYAGFDVAFFSVNTLDERDLALSYLDQQGASPETVYGIDDGSAAAFSYGVGGLPETFFVDRSGTVVGKVIGPVTYELLSATIDKILLGQDVDSVKTGETETVG